MLETALRGGRLRFTELAGGSEWLAQDVAVVIALDDAELSGLSDAIANHAVDDRDRLLAGFVATSRVAVDAVDNEERHVHSLGTAAVADNFGDGVKQALGVRPDVHVSRTELLS